MPIDEVGVRLFEDRVEEGIFRVEYNDDDGGSYVTIFAGPAAERRARAYFDALKAGTLKVITSLPEDQLQ